MLGPFPAVVILHASWEFNNTHDVARRFASKSYAALAVNQPGIEHDIQIYLVA